MIDYKFPEEKDIILHYAHQLHAFNIVAIINKGYVENADEAKQLSKFFWLMVDQSVIDAEHGIAAAGYHNLEAYNEYIMHSLRAYLIKAGYAQEWETEN
ncbi:hypothetical protein [Methylomonas sp. AM2-LC]|uniref:hypothetical protein n=1 Tax=Methylomonas sp. AM2-LC TaxID=3153301 RepID=UPI003267ADD2